ncbi:histone H2AX [Tanacetum coccineum]
MDSTKETKTKSTAGRGKPKSTKSVTRSAKAGLTFPVGRILRYLRNGRYAKRVGSGCPVYLFAILEYLAAEVLELAGNATRDNKKSRINPRHILLAVRNDEELGKLLGGVTIANGGVLPKIHPSLVPNKKVKDGKDTIGSVSQDYAARLSDSTTSADVIEESIRKQPDDEDEPLSYKVLLKTQFMQQGFLCSTTFSDDVIEESIRKQPDDWIQQFPSLQNLGVHMFNQQSKDRINQSATRKE